MLSAVVRLIVLSTFMLLAACGPESNSRYGDQFWDPWDTKETFDPIRSPDYSVEFVDTDDSDGEEIFEARITLDATATAERVYSYSWGFIRGTRERETLSPLGASSDNLVVYREDPNDPNQDERLVATTPGEYRMVFVGEADGPLGKVTARFDDMSFTLPGCQTTYDYYEDYIDNTLQECAECHQTGDAASFDTSTGDVGIELPDNNFNSRRQNLLQHLERKLAVPDDDQELVLPEWAVNTSHLGSDTISEGSAAYQRLAEFVDIIEQVYADQGTLTTANNADGDPVPGDYCIDRPDGFEFIQE